MENQQMQDILNKQKAYFIKNGPPSYDLRIDRLDRMKSLIMDNRYKFCLLYTSPSPRDR